jgi:hypothetical protein
MSISNPELRVLVEQVAAHVLKKYQGDPQKEETKAFFSPKKGLEPEKKAQEQVQSVDSCELEVSSLSVAQLAKLVHFIWDDPFVESLGQALLSGKKIVVADPAWKNKSRWKEKNPSLGNALSALMERAKQLGVQFEKEAIKEEVVHQKVLTLEDIQAYEKRGVRALIVPSNCIVTSLAEEAAAQKEILIRKI